MKRTHLGIQAIVLLTMVWFVSWPAVRPSRALSIWRYSPEAVVEARTADAAHYTTAAVASGPRASTPARRSTVPRAPATHDSPVGNHERVDSRVVNDERLDFTPGAIVVLGARDNALVGLAQNSLNAVIPFARLVLRDIRTGQALQQATADELGQFSFIDLPPGEYVVELLGKDGSVVAASDVVTTSKDGLVRTVVRVAPATAAVMAMFGSTALSPTLPQVKPLATSSDVTRTSTTQTPRVTSTGN